MPQAVALHDIVAVPDPIIWPALAGGGMDAVMVKSGNGTTLTVTVVLWARPPPVPVRVTV